MKHTARLTLSCAVLMLLGACVHRAPEDHVQIFGSEKAVARSVVDMGHDDDVAQHPDKYEGRTVRMKGEVDKVISDRGFVMDLPGVFGKDKVLIFNNTGYTVPVREGDQIEVTGPVRVFNVSELETELNGSLLEEVYTEYRDEPVVVAQVIKGYWAQNRASRPLQQVVREREPEAPTEYSH